MLKSGAIVGVIGFVLILLVSLLSPLCGVCLAIFLGLAAGYLAGRDERPIDSGEAVKVGAGAGALAGGLAIPGQLIAAAINASALPNSGINELFGLPPSDPMMVWILQLTVGCCVGMLNLAIMAGAGAGGSGLWYQRSGTPRTQEPIPPAL